MIVQPPCLGERPLIRYAFWRLNPRTDDHFASVRIIIAGARR